MSGEIIQHVIVDSLTPPTGASATQVQGDVAHDAVDSGNPVKVGGKYNATLPTLTNGQRGDLQLAPNATVIVSGTVAHDAVDSGYPVKIGGKASTSVPTAVASADLTNGWYGPNGQMIVGGSYATPADGLPNAAAAVGLASPYSNNGVGQPIGTLASVFNGTTWDRLRTPNVFKNLSAVVITSETTIWTPTSGKKFRLMGFYLTQGVLTGAITLKDNTGGSTILIIPQHTIGIAMSFVLMGNGILSAAANNVLTATGATAETITGFVFGTEE